MAKTLRVGVFETNSSSSHSISICGIGQSTDSLHVSEDGVCRIYAGEFGWEEETFWDAASKASYCLTFCKSLSDTGHCEEMLRTVITKQTGCKAVEFCSNESKFYEWGYIDHQSHSVCKEAFQDEESLRSFIFNPKSYLRTDNDNH